VISSFRHGGQHGPVLCVSQVKEAKELPSSNRCNGKGAQHSAASAFWVSIWKGKIRGLRVFRVDFIVPARPELIPTLLPFPLSRERAQCVKARIAARKVVWPIEQHVQNQYVVDKTLLNKNPQVQLQNVEIESPLNA